MEEKHLLIQFSKFLKKHNVYESYFHNCMKCDVNKIKTKNDFSNFIVRNIKKKKGLNLINDAFCWSSTKEGNRFWYKLHNDWVEICLQKKK